MFGSALGSAESDFQIVDGWFANITSAYDPEHTLVGQEVNTNHNPYGLVDASCNFQVHDDEKFIKWPLFTFFLTPF